MPGTNQSPSEGEDNDVNKKEPHDPVEAGKKAIEAERLVNEKNNSAPEQNSEEKADAEKWRNEG